MLLTCSLTTRPTQAHPAGLGPGLAPGPSASPRTPRWPWSHAARHPRHAAARVQTRLQTRQPPRQPWQNPCGTSVAVAPMAPPARHPRPNKPNGPRTAPQDFDWPNPPVDGVPMERKGWSLRTVRVKIRNARAHLRHRRQHINQVYGGYKMLQKFSFDWLPQQQVQWYRSEIKCLDRDSQAAQVLPALRSALQNFSATFVEMQKARQWTIDRPGLRNRTLIINELATHVKGMLCEVETAMQERSLPLPPAGLPADGLAGVEPSLWNPDPDLTGALIQDWGVVRAYTDALYGWALILRELGHARKVRRGEADALGALGALGARGSAGDTPHAGRGCGQAPDTPVSHRLHGRHRNQLRRKQRRHPGGRGGGGGGKDNKEARRKRRRRRKQRERRKRRRRLLNEMARRNGGRPWRPRQVA